MNTGDRVRDTIHDRTGTIVPDTLASRFDYLAVKYDDGSGVGWHTPAELRYELSIAGREGKPRTGSEAMLLAEVADHPLFNDNGPGSCDARESGAPNANRIAELEQQVDDLQDEVNELRGILVTLGTTLGRIL